MVIGVSGGIGKGWPMKAKLQFQWGKSYAIHSTVTVYSNVTLYSQS